MKALFFVFALVLSFSSATHAIEVYDQDCSSISNVTGSKEVKKESTDRDPSATGQ